MKRQPSESELKNKIKLTYKSVCIITPFDCINFKYIGCVTRMDILLAVMYLNCFCIATTL